MTTGPGQVPNAFEMPVDFTENFLAKRERAHTNTHFLLSFQDMLLGASNMLSKDSFTVQVAGQEPNHATLTPVGHNDLLCHQITFASKEKKMGKSCSVL